MRSLDANHAAYHLISPIARQAVALAANQLIWEDASYKNLYNHAYLFTDSFQSGMRDRPYLSLAALCVLALPDAIERESKGPLQQLTAHTTIPSYHRLPYHGLLRVAETYKEGAEKYSEFNWERGMPVLDLLNHADQHLQKYNAGDRSENHFGHAGWNYFAAIHSFILWPELNKTFRGPNCSLTPGIHTAWEAFWEKKKRGKTN